MLGANEQLLEDGIITSEQYVIIKNYEKTKPLSIHWELRTILYLGILLFTSGISILIYQNIDTIGHQAILGFIGLGTISCFYYALKNKLPYSNRPTKHDSPFFDYIILLGCLLFGIFIGYLQYQYSIFGLHYGIATFIPTVLFFSCAYYFDHKGILSLGISGLAAWAGLTVTPLQLLESNDFSDTRIIVTAILLGVTIAVLAIFSDLKDIKKHFSFSYHNFAINILCIAMLSALFEFSYKFFTLIFLIGICYYYFKYAISRQSFLFLVLSIIYGYIGITYLLFRTMSNIDLNEGLFMLGFFYISGSCVGIVFFFLNYKRILKLK